MFIRTITTGPATGFAAALAVLLTCAPDSGRSQWLNAPAEDAPRTPDGEIDLEAPPPRHENGRPSLEGIWMPDDNRYIRDMALDLGDDNVPYLPWAKRLFDERKTGEHSREDPDAHCLPQGVPKIDWVSYPWKLIETPESVVIIYETFTFWRQIFTDGRELSPTAKPSWMGYSTGRWDGDTFVVTTRGFSEGSDDGLPGAIEGLLFNGANSRVLVRAAGELIEVDDPHKGTVRRTVGEAVTLGWDVGQARAFAAGT
jgi:hypothetical protein